MKELPKGWKWVRFENVCDIISGKNQSKVINPSGKYPIYGSSGIFGFADEYLCEAGTTIIGRKGTINKPLFVNTRFWNVDTAFGLSTNEHYNNKLLFYFCLSFNFQKLDKSTTIPSLAKRDLLVIDIPLPPLPIQQAIVSKIEELFSELDKGIENLKTAQAQLKVYRQSVLKWAFEGKLTSLNHDSLDLPDEHDLAMVAEPQEVYGSNKSRGNYSVGKEGLMDGWTTKFLKEVCLIRRGKSKHRPRNEPSLFGGKYPFIQTGDIRNANGGLIKNFTQTYSEKGLEQSKLWPKGTLCITIAANIGETAILNMDACFPDSVVGLLCNEEKLLVNFANYFFISHKSKLEQLAPATAQKNINVDILEKVKIPLPSIAEQYKVIEKIESRLSVADKMEEIIQQSLLQAEGLRQSILKKAFEGELVT